MRISLRLAKRRRAIWKPIPPSPVSTGSAAGRTARLSRRPAAFERKNTTGNGILSIRRENCSSRTALISFPIGNRPDSICANTTLKTVPKRTIRNSKNSGESLLLRRDQISIAVTISVPLYSIITDATWNANTAKTGRKFTLNS